jgi:hypothetical protein
VYLVHLANIGQRAGGGVPGELGEHRRRAAGGGALGETGELGELGEHRRRAMRKLETALAEHGIDRSTLHDWLPDR